MRVIAGTVKGKKLLPVNNNSIRPTENRVKEALFSIVQFKLQNATLLDLFAGSGQIAIEALSRGADFCMCVDWSIDARKIQIKNLKNTNFLHKCKIITANVLKFLNKNKLKFDLIFLDPPYGSDLLLKTLKLAINSLNSNGIIVCEHESALKMPTNFYNIKLQKQYGYGKINLTLYGLQNE